MPEALEAARRHGIALSPAAEISSVHDAYEDLHVLGYGIDHTDPALRATLEDWRSDRGRRIVAMADRLEELGFALDRSPLERRAGEGKPLGRPHLAQAVLSHPGNRDRLAREGIAGPDELFPAYLVPGAPAYVGRERPTVAQAVDVIHAAGGVAVWAHPFWDLEGPGEAVAAIDAFDGLDGVECFYVTHTRRRPGCSTGSAASAVCSSPGRPTSTARGTTASTPSGRSRPTGSSRTSGASRHAEAVELADAPGPLARPAPRRRGHVRPARPVRRPREGLRPDRAQHRPLRPVRRHPDPAGADEQARMYDSLTPLFDQVTAADLTTSFKSARSASETRARPATEATPRRGAHASCATASACRTSSGAPATT